MGLFDFLKKNKNIENDNGLNEIYTNNGKGVLREKFNKKNGKLDGLYQLYVLYDHWSNTGDAKPWEVGNYKNGEKDGVWKKYIGQYEKVLNWEGNYKDGMLHGISKSNEFSQTFKAYGPVYSLVGSDHPLPRPVKATVSKFVNLVYYKNGVKEEVKKYEFVRYDKNEIIFGDLISETYFENGEEKRNN